MNITAFLGSPRRGGNTETLLNEAIRGTGHDVKVFNLNSMRITPCQNCGGCTETGQCIYQDDDMPRIYESISEADRIILASPVFFMGLSAQAKLMVDRCQCFWCGKYLLKRPITEGALGRKGLLILVGGMKKDSGIKCAELSAIAFFRTINVPAHQSLLYTGIDAIGEVLRHPTAMKDAFEAGAALVGKTGI